MSTLEQINDYYHEELSKVLSIMYMLQEMEMKCNVKLPKHIEDEVYYFTESFKFRYLD